MTENINILIGCSLLVLVAVFSLWYATRMRLEVKSLNEDNRHRRDDLENLGDLFRQTTDLLLSDRRCLDADGRALHLLDKVTFVSDDRRLEGTVRLNTGNNGRISAAVPVCIQTDDRECFMIPLVSDIRVKERKERRLKQ